MSLPAIPLRPLPPAWWRCTLCRSPRTEFCVTSRVLDGLGPRDTHLTWLKVLSIAAFYFSISKSKFSLWSKYCYISEKCPIKKKKIRTHFFAPWWNPAALPLTHSHCAWVYGKVCLFMFLLRGKEQNISSAWELQGGNTMLLTGKRALTLDNRGFSLVIPGRRRKIGCPEDSDPSHLFQVSPGPSGFSESLPIIEVPCFCCFLAILTLPSPSPHPTSLISLLNVINSNLSSPDYMTQALNLK